MSSSPVEAQTAARWIRAGAKELAEALRAGTISSIEATEACIARIEQVNPRINALAAADFKRARCDALAADQRRADGQWLGPLHGLPCTLKECWHVEGLPTTLGLTRRAKILESRDGVLAERLRAAGAIILGKTNVPQLMLWHESDNPLYGRTNNPWSLRHTCGGSTGGEAALIACFGSPWGLGTDIGGSIRVPCHFCGVAGIKPTSGRLSKEGMMATFSQLHAMELESGPMARSVEDLEWLLPILVDLHGKDDAPPLEESSKVDVSKLRIGVLETNDYFHPSPAMRRVVREAARALSQRGASVQPLQVTGLREAVQSYFALLGADGGEEFRLAARGSRRDPRLRRLLRIGAMPTWARQVLGALLHVIGQHRFADLARATGRGGSNKQGREVLQHAAQFQSALASELAKQCDAWLAPPFGLTAFPHGRGVDLLAAGTYAYLPSYLNLPCGVVPASRVLPGEESDRPRSRQWDDRYARQAERISTGLPVGVQVVGVKWKDHQVLAVMRELQNFFQGQPHYPRPPWQLDAVLSQDVRQQ